MALSTPSAFPVRVIRINHPRDIHHSQLDPPLSFLLARRHWAPTSVATFTSASNAQINYDATVTVISTPRQVTPVTSAMRHTVLQL